ncbi:CopG family transcriptional regulator [Georgenia sunbinii]|uniref:ribbon-helix-helix domain-containing protein n=1 Tax=Georgenia sunbinii TaxID=3117728 RepID=UPI002F26991D
MSFEITNRVPGVSDKDVAAMTAEAQDGYDLAETVAEPNPHFQRLQLVPDDLLEAIDERARRDGQSPDAVVRQALATYLHTA